MGRRHEKRRKKQQYRRHTMSITGLRGKSSVPAVDCCRISAMTDLSAQWNVPERLRRLKDLAYNLWWSWHPEARALFKEIDLALWQESHHNPVHLLQRSQTRLAALANDPLFLARYDAVIRAFDTYLAGEDTWFKRSHPEFGGKAVAYFSAEFGLHNSLKIY